MGQAGKLKLHPLVEKRHQIYKTWWGSLLRHDDCGAGMAHMFILSVLTFSVAIRSLDIIQVFRWFAAGLVFGTLVEYFTHRVVFHQLWKIRLFRGLQEIHIPHHYEMNDGVNAGPLFYFPLYFLFALIFWSISNSFSIALSILSGFGFWFMLYEYTHFVYHVDLTHPHLHWKRSKYMNFMNQYHRWHHERKWGKNFGITQPLWDMVFGTFVRVKTEK